MAVQPKLWKKKNAAARVRREYLSAEDVLAKAAEAPSAAPPQAVLDMRGPQARLVTNLEHLNMSQAAQNEATPMPELQHNLRLLVDLAEAEIQRLDGKLRHEKVCRLCCAGHWCRAVFALALTGCCVGRSLPEGPSMHMLLACLSECLQLKRQSMHLRICDGVTHIWLPG